MSGAVAIVTLDAPDRRNALTPAMASELVATFDEVDDRPEIGTLVVRAVGKSFYAGGDIATLPSVGKDPVAPEAYEGMGKIYDSVYRLGQVRVPTVAAVRGSAVGAGMNMLLAADLRVVARDARLLCGFPNRGMHPGGGHFAILSRLVGRGAAAAMALFGEEINGDRVVELGLASESVDDAAVEARALELAVRVAADPELARVAVGEQGGRQRRGGLGRRDAARTSRPDLVEAPFGSLSTATSRADPGFLRECGLRRSTTHGRTRWLTYACESRGTARRSRTRSSRPAAPPTRRGTR